MSRKPRRRKSTRVSPTRLEELEYGYLKYPKPTLRRMREFIEEFKDADYDRRVRIVNEINIDAEEAESLSEIAAVSPYNDLESAQRFKLSAKHAREAAKHVDPDEIYRKEHWRRRQEYWRRKKGESA